METERCGACKAKITRPCPVLVLGAHGDTPRELRLCRPCGNELNARWDELISIPLVNALRRDGYVDTGVAPS